MPRCSGLPSTGIAVPGNQRGVLNLFDQEGVVLQDRIYRCPEVAAVVGDDLINLVFVFQYRLIHGPFLLPETKPARSPSRETVGVIQVQIVQ